MGQTHNVVFADQYVLKRYVSCHGDEHTREWMLLRAVSRHAPDLVPRPLDADLDDQPPWVTMSRLPGEPLQDHLSTTQLDAMAVALDELWAVPAGDLPPRRLHPVEAHAVIGDGLAQADRPDGVAGKAYDICLEHLGRPLHLSGRAVVGHADPNVSNYLWDGATVRLVDFEDAGISTVEYELAFLVEHLSARGMDWLPLLRRFGPDMAQLRSARLTSAAHWLLLLLPGGPAAVRNPPGTLEAQAGRIISLAGGPGNGSRDAHR